MRPTSACTQWRTQVMIAHCMTEAWVPVPAPLRSWQCDLGVFPLAAEVRVNNVNAKAHASMVPPRPSCLFQFLWAPIRSRPHGRFANRGQISSSKVLPHLGLAHLTSGWIKAKLPSMQILQKLISSELSSLMFYCSLSFK